jgi:hypothetical protein
MDRRTRCCFVVVCTALLGAGFPHLSALLYGFSGVLVGVPVVERPAAVYGLPEATVDELEGVAFAALEHGQDGAGHKPIGEVFPAVTSGPHP